MQRTVPRRKVLEEPDRQDDDREQQGEHQPLVPFQAEHHPAERVRRVGLRVGRRRCCPSVLSPFGVLGGVSSSAPGASGAFPSPLYHLGGKPTHAGRPGRERGGSSSRQARGGPLSVTSWPFRWSAITSRDQPVALRVGMDVDLEEQPLAARGTLPQDAGEVEIGHAKLVEPPRERRCQVGHRLLEQRLERLPLGRKQGHQELRAVGGRRGAQLQQDLDHALEPRVTGVRERRHPDLRGRHPDPPAVLEADRAPSHRCADLLGPKVQAGDQVAAHQGPLDLGEPAAAGALRAPEVQSLRLARRDPVVEDVDRAERVRRVEGDHDQLRAQSRPERLIGQQVLLRRRRQDAEVHDLELGQLLAEQRYPALMVVDPEAEGQGVAEDHDVRARRPG